MADLRLLGLALGNAQGGFDAAQRGLELALAQDQKMRQAKEQMMELALKDAFYERKQQQMALDLISNVPALNQALIDDETRAALSPLGRVSSINAPQSLGLQTTPIPQVVAPDLDIGGLGPGAKKIEQGYKTGVNQYDMVPSASPTPSPTPEKKLPAKGRKPQGDIVEPLEDQVLNQALDETVRPSPYSALNNSEFQQKMFDAMARVKSAGQVSPLMDPEFVQGAMNMMAFEGGVPGMAVQSKSTLDALKGIRDAGFMAAKTSAGMNQQAQEMNAKLEMQRLQSQKEFQELQIKLAQQAGDKQAELSAKAKADYFKGLIDVMQTFNRPAPRGSSKEDPNAADYRRQLNQFKQSASALQAEVVKKYRVMSPQNVQRLVRTNPKTWGPIVEEGQRLYELGAKYPSIRANYAGFSNLIGPAGKVGGAELKTESLADRARRAREAKEKAAGSPRG